MKKNQPYHQESMFKGAPPESFAKAEVLRNNMTGAEKILWDHLKNKIGYKFRRQHPIHIYIVDFYCHQLKLVIEVDGEYHNTPEQKEKDDERTGILQFQDLEIIRFTNQQVFNDVGMVMKKIEEKINSLNNREEE